MNVQSGPFLTYNSNSALQTEYGYGWSGSLKPKVTEVDSTTAKVTDSTGAVLRYTNKDANGKYLAPGGVRNSLVKNADGTWTETQPDGFKLRYDTAGRLHVLETRGGGRYTATHDGGGKLTYVLDPFNGRTSFAYDGNNKIKRIQQADGRITSFSVDSSGDLASRTTPELCQTAFRYTSQHRMTAHVDPMQNRTSWTYDGDGWVKSILTPKEEKGTQLIVFGRARSPGRPTPG